LCRPGFLVAGLLLVAGCAARDERTLPSKGPADNSPCLVCHADLEDEVIVREHATEGIGCASCHGPSEVHGGDELNIMTPDVLFGRSEIAPFCEACHPKHEKPGEVATFLATWKGKRRPNGRMILDDSVCTDCHGNHAAVEAHQQGLGTES